MIRNLVTRFKEWLDEPMIQPAIEGVTWERQAELDEFDTCDSTGETDA